ncbi:hypothetical protein FACS1894139_13050 [Planctomycetales bacterium]|nr:hypothetical protein FACS1894107_05180 [Planctomycetales bacterium]GHS99862.1 hypothetical protein FACS1894108_10670 [Planctomycetales bacterium]GHT06667.1 hypothetical protein FACS1894139_13050 [Planctomycetales bacterium]
MGHVYAEIALSNYADDIAVKEGRLDEREARRTIVNSLVDSGATMLTITPSVQKQLGLRKIGEEVFILADQREITCDIVGPVEVRFAGRFSLCDAVVMPHANEVLLGAIPMEEMNLVIYPDEGRLDVNPKRRVARIGLR